MLPEQLKNITRGHPRIKALLSKKSWVLVRHGELWRVDDNSRARLDDPRTWGTYEEAKSGANTIVKNKPEELDAIGCVVDGEVEVFTGRTFLEIALNCIARGWSVFPCKPAGKAPLTEHGYKDASKDENQIRELWKKHPYANVAIACGASNLTVVDCDHGNASADEAIAWMTRSGLLETYTVRTGRRFSKDCSPECGVQLYYSGTMASTTFEIAGGFGEIKSDGGYVMAAGCIHPESGKQYVVLQDLPLTPLPEIVKSLEKQKRGHKREHTPGVTVDAQTLEEYRQFLHSYIAEHDLVFRHYEKPEPDGLWLGIACLWGHASGSPGSESSTVIGFFGKNIVFKCAHATCADRDTSVFCEEMFNREAEKHEATKIKIGNPPDLEPPTYISSRCGVSVSRPDEPMPDMPSEQEQENTLNTNEIKHEIDPSTGEIVKLDRRKLVYAPWEMEEMKMAPTRWLIDGLLPEVGTSLISAGPKTGKGTLTRQMAIAVAEGKKFLNRETRRGTVLYCSRQEKLGELIKLFKKANRGKMPDVMISPVETLQLGAKTPVDAIRQLVTEAVNQNKGKPVRLVCLDMLTSFFKMSDSNQYSETFDVLEPLQSLAVELDIHICVIHHANKSATPDLLDVRSVMGSGAIAGSVDQVILLSNDPSTDRRVITTVQRTGEGLPKHWLKWDPDTRTVDLGDPWNRNASRSREADTEQNIVRFIEDNPRCSRTKLCTSLGGDKTRVKRILDGLVEKGTVQESTTGAGSSLFIAGEF